MHSGREAVLASWGPFTVIQAFSASKQERAQALPAWRALRIVEEMAREATAADRRLIARLLALLPFPPALSEPDRQPLAIWVDPIREAVRSARLLFIPGWHRAVDTFVPSRSAEPEPEAPLPAARQPAQKLPELLFEYRSNTGHPIHDDDGFELRGPDGTLEKGLLSNGRLQKKGVAAGLYELRTRALKSASWSVSSASPFDLIELRVRSKNLPDGTQLQLVIRRAHGMPDAAPVVSLQTVVQSDQATVKWTYAQGVGERLFDHFEFTASFGKKQAWSQVLTIAPHDIATPPGLGERLRALGYDPGPVADSITTQLRAALRRFQEAHPPLVATGDPDPFTVELLDAQIS